MFYRKQSSVPVFPCGNYHVLLVLCTELSWPLAPRFWHDDGDWLFSVSLSKGNSYSAVACPRKNYATEEYNTFTLLMPSYLFQLDIYLTVLPLFRLSFLRDSCLPANLMFFFFWKKKKCLNVVKWAVLFLKVDFFEALSINWVDLPKRVKRARAWSSKPP